MLKKGILAKQVLKMQVPYTRGFTACIREHIGPGDMSKIWIISMYSLNDQTKVP